MNEEEILKGLESEPPTEAEALLQRRFLALFRVMRKLRGPDGCPWDRAQDLKSLRRFLLEETHELLEAIDKEDSALHQEELGDVLLQVVFQSAIQEDARKFDLSDVLAGITQKMVHRHPHVFGDASPEEAQAAWGRKKEHDDVRPVASRVPAGLPALLWSQRMSEKAAKLGFDWTNWKGPAGKVTEELEEVREAIQQKSQATPDAMSGAQSEVASELGDLLFAAVNLARHLEVSSEDALRDAGRRFSERFEWVQVCARDRGERLADLSAEELDALWEEAKRKTQALGPK